MLETFSIKVSLLIKGSLQDLNMELLPLGRQRDVLNLKLRFFYCSYYELQLTCLSLAEKTCRPDKDHIRKRF